MIYFPAIHFKQLKGQYMQAMVESVRTFHISLWSMSSIVCESHIDSCFKPEIFLFDLQHSLYE